MKMFSKITATVVRFRNDRDGVTALEYGLIASLVAVAIVAAVGTLGTNLTSEFNYIAGKL